ncbi:TRAP transporter small permease subunit [Prochlorococcus sp. MIT 1307]|uniref:TRAP transporter small permease subunit n=1 Tax=Prochlorococcus sp. MIT 1307 TaxID=3096219 RepID=UPI002A753D35|nr:TRAP transporter small permease subunit [Prochlorococcus sp. MIT 1307]
MKQWLAFSTRIDNLNKKVAVIARWSIFLMLGLGLWNVIGRYVGVAIGHNLSSNRLIEAQWYLFDLAFLLGLGWTLQNQGHVRVDVLQGRWSERRKAKIELLGTLLLLLPFALGIMAISIEPTLHSWSIAEVSPDPNGLPRYWVKTLIPIGFLLLALQGFSEAIQNWGKVKNSSSRTTPPDNINKENYLD